MSCNHFVGDRVTFKGLGLSPYPEGGIATLFDWVESQDGKSKHLMPHCAQFIIDVVEIEPNAVHQHSKPGDEVVVVLNGTLILTTDVTQAEQIFQAGEMVIIPAGWAGIYRVTSDDSRFRELCIMPSDYFSATPRPSGQSPRRLALPLAGRHEVHRNTYTVEVQNLDRADKWLVATASDEIVHVLSGALTLSAAGDKASFGVGSFVVLPKGFSGEAAATPGYRAMHLRWLG